MNFRVCLALSLSVLARAAYADVTLEEPRGGWRNSAGDATGFRQEVHYPASSVNVENAPASARIRGSIARAPKAAKLEAARAPATLVVNGVPMPLSLEQDGTFARPYAFGRGSNNVEVRSASGERRRVNFYESYTGRTAARLRVLLAWDSDHTDLDLHVIAPDGSHTWYGDRVADNGGALDVDVTTGFGPEIYANPTPPPGVYHVYVNYYGSGDDQGTVTTATVTIITEEGSLAEKRQTFRMPMRKPGELTLVRSFTVR